MLDEMKRDISFHINIELLTGMQEATAGYRNQQVKELENEKIDLLIVSPNEAQPFRRQLRKHQRRHSRCGG